MLPRPQACHTLHLARDNHLNVHVPVQLRDGRAGQPTSKVEPVTVLRHHMLDLQGTRGSISPHSEVGARKGGGSSLIQRAQGSVGQAKAATSSHQLPLVQAVDAHVCQGGLGVAQVSSTAREVKGSGNDLATAKATAQGARHLPHGSAFLKQRPHSVGSPIIRDRGCLCVRERVSPTRKRKGMCQLKDPGTFSNGLWAAQTA